MRLSAVSLLVSLVSLSLTSVQAQDPGLPDSLLIGNLNRTPIRAFLGATLVVPVWVRTDDSVFAMHIPVASDTDYISSRNGGLFYPPVTLWDYPNFTTSTPDSILVGYTNQGIIAFAYFTDPRDPQNFLMTHYSWVHIADFHMTSTANSFALGDSTQLRAGHSPTAGALSFILSDGVTSLVPATIYGKIAFVEQGPQVVSVAPPQNSRGISPTTTISATFDRNLQPGSVSDTTFIVTGSISGRQFPTYIYYDIPSRTAHFYPYQGFVTGETVTATLKRSIYSTDGIPMDSSFTWSFTIRADSGFAIYDSSTFTPAASGVFWVVAAKLNGDNCLDMATANTNTNNISVYFNDCDRSFTLSGNYTVGSQPRAIAAADFNSDGHIDLATANSGSMNISVLFNNGDGTFTLSNNYSTGGPSQRLKCSDLNGDGYIDIAVTGGDSGKVDIFLNNGSGIFPSTPSQICNTQEGAVDIFMGDFNGDHCPDLAVTSGDSTSILIYNNNGDGTFPPLPSGSYSSQGSSWGIFSADLNGDSYMDLAVTNSVQHTVSVLFNDHNGNFPVIDGSYETSGSAWGIFCADLNGDDYIDMAVSNADNGEISIFLNNGNGTFLPTTMGSYETNGSAWGLFSADMDNDGAIDLIVSNSNSDGVTELWNQPYGYSYVPGDVNGSHSYNGLDVVYSVSYFKGGPAPRYAVECPAFQQPIWFVSGDVNGSCSFNGLDATYGVAYFKGGPAPHPCPNCPPLGR